MVVAERGASHKRVVRVSTPRQSVGSTVASPIDCDCRSLEAAFTERFVLHQYACKSLWEYEEPTRETRARRVAPYFPSLDFRRVFGDGPSREAIDARSGRAELAPIGSSIGIRSVFAEWELVPCESMIEIARTRLPELPFRHTVSVLKPFYAERSQSTIQTAARELMRSRRMEPLRLTAPATNCGRYRSGGERTGPRYALSREIAPVTSVYLSERRGRRRRSRRVSHRDGSEDTASVHDHGIRSRYGNRGSPTLSNSHFRDRFSYYSKFERFRTAGLATARTRYGRAVETDEGRFHRR